MTIWQVKYYVNGTFYADISTLDQKKKTEEGR